MARRMIAISLVIGLIGGYITIKLQKVFFPPLPEGFKLCKIQGIAIMDNGTRLGQVNPDQVVNTAINICNLRKNPIKISRIRTSCKCLAAWPEEKLIESRQIAEIPVRLHAPGQEYQLDKFAVTLLLEIDDSNKNKLGNLLIGFTGKLNKKPVFKVWPQVLDFGEIKLNEKKEIELFFLSDNKEIESLPKELSLDFNSVNTLKLQTNEHTNMSHAFCKSLLCSISIPDSTAAGPISGLLTLERQGHETQTIQIPIKGEIIGDIIISPKVALLNVKQDTLNSKCTIIIERKDKQETIIKNIECDLPLQIELEEDKSLVKHHIKLKWPENQQLTQQRQGLIHIQDSNNDSIDIKVFVVPTYK